MILPPSPKRRRRTYTIEDKLIALDMLANGESESAVSSAFTVPESTLRGWRKLEPELRGFTGSKRRKALDGAGRPELIPFSEDLVEFMTELREHDEVLSSHHMMSYMKDNQNEWLNEYLAVKSNDVAGYNSLLRLCQRFANRHGFAMRVPSFTKEPTEQLLQIRVNFCREFWSTYRTYAAHEILNMDETSMYFDTPPHRIWAKKGGSAKINKTQKHSVRITVVLTIRADGTKLPLLFIVRGKPGGRIERYEYPDGHVYAVQQKAWMDAQVWQKYVSECLAPEVKGPSVLLLDNFDSHVSEEGQAAVAERACCAVCPLPANATSVCQPLDVGVMRPLKSRLRSLWLREPNTAKTAAQKRLVMIKRAITAYEGLESETISGSFVAAIPRPDDL